MCCIILNLYIISSMIIICFCVTEKPTVLSKVELVKNPLYIS